MSRSIQRGPEPSHRMLRVAERVRHVVSDLLARGEIQDEALEGLIISVSRVAMSSDLKLATIYVLPLLASAHSGAAMADVVEAFRRNHRFIRARIAAEVNLKFAPDVRFKADENFAAGARIDALLDTPKVQRDVFRGQTQQELRDGLEGEGHADTHDV